jgi:hypothetical protein
VPDPLVELALEARRSLTPPAPSAAFAAASRTRLVQRLARPAQPLPRRDRLSTFRPRGWKPALAGLIVIIALLGGGLGVTYAAADSLPGDPLYGAKRGLERLQLALTSTPAGLASLRARLATERLEEAEALVEAGRQAEANDLLGEYQAEITEMVGLVQHSSDSERVQGLQQALAAQQEVLVRLLERSGESADTAAGAAIEEARHSQAVLELLLEGGSPSDLAPGQQDRGTPDSEVGPGRGQGQGQGQGGGRWHRTPTPTVP